ncbi:nitrogen fixation protein NifX [Roseospirillum parvum]|uniref:Nitrogen fixation protein NifX n=1 Tax=Roseospirillum parvum TaxID=83401 RepID=A0A1G8GAB5_9PROT|nr:nitrogen fixation protein NifX [Roseospirillum parvum]SDH91256.1 nitrogen fixation protein NifX [Roseospirillum parvum]
MAARRLSVVDTDPAPAAAPGPRLRVALATQDMRAVNAHFAGARTLAIYDVGLEDATLIEAVQFADPSPEDGRHDDSAGRLEARIAALEGCALLFVRAIGGPAAAKVIKARVHPMKVADDTPVDEVLARVQTMMKGTPPPWLRKILAVDAPDSDRPAFLDDDE